MKLIEEYQHNGIGYNPFIIREGWQVAQLNHVEGQGIDDIVKIDVHLQTDEVFVLLKGKAVLIAIEKNADELKFQAILMQQGITYNIPKNVWHNIAMQLDAQVIIVEKDNTHEGDYEYYYLNPSQKNELHNYIAEALNK